jgi:hypothetical protein
MIGAVQDGTDGLDGADGLDGLDGWLAEQRADAAIEERRRATWLRRRSEEGATFVGALVVAAERAQPVVLTTTAGRVHRGVIRVVGDDACVVRTGRGIVVVAIGAVATMRPVPEAPGPAGASPFVDDDVRGGRPGLTMLALLEDAVAERAEVAVVVQGVADPMVGTLTSAGVDVLTLDPGPVVVARHAVSEVLLAG